MPPALAWWRAKCRAASEVDRPRGRDQGGDDGRRHCLAGRYARTGIAGVARRTAAAPQAAFRLIRGRLRQGRRFHGRRLCSRTSRTKLHCGRFCWISRVRQPVVTGASSDEGIGSECAKILASRGCNVVVNYASNKAGGEAIVAACKAAGADAIAVQGDVSKDADCKRLVQAAIDQWGRLDVLINNAATTKPIPHKRMDLLDGDEFLRIYRRQRGRHLSDDARGGAASQGDGRRRDRQHLVGRRDARGRLVDGLYRVEGRAQQPDALDRARAGAGGAGQRALPGRHARRAGRARSSPRSSIRSG